MDFCKDFSISTESKERRRWQGEDFVTFSQTVADVPSTEEFLGKIQDRARKHFELGSNAGPDAVVIGTTPDGRVFYRHSWEHRFQQSLLLLAIQAPIERRLARGIQVYRGGGSHLTALQAWRELPARYRYQRRGDFQQCFPSIPLKLVDNVLRQQRWLSDEVVDCIVSSLSPTIVHLPRTCPQAPYTHLEGGTEWKYAPRILLTGAPLVPPLVTFVLSEIVFKPLLLKFGKKLRIIVCADDFLLVGTSAAIVDEAMTFIAETLRLRTNESLKLHPEKTMDRTVDVTQTAIGFVGKILHNKSIRTPKATWEAWARQLVRLYSTSDFRPRAIAMLDNMTKEDRKSLWRFHGFILRASGDKSRGKEIVKEFEKIRTTWSTSEKGADAPEEDEYLDVYDQGETVVREWARPLFGKLAQEVSADV